MWMSIQNVALLYATNDTRIMPSVPCEVFCILTDQNVSDAISFVDCVIGILVQSNVKGANLFIFNCFLVTLLVIKKVSFFDVRM